MKEKIRLRIHQYKKGENIPKHKKDLSLPIYLHKPDDFAMFIAKHCGCHFFHISYSNRDNKTRRLCDIKITSCGKKQVEYAILFHEDQARLTLLLERNKKKRHLMKETTSAGKKSVGHKHGLPDAVSAESMYG